MSKDNELQAAVRMGQRAVDYDNAQRYQEAVYFYVEAANRLLDLLNKQKCMALMRKKAEEWIGRAEFLKRELPRLLEQVQTTRSPLQLAFEKAEFAMCRALDRDERGEWEAAQLLYHEAIQLSLDSSKSAPNSLLAGKFATLAREALERAEQLAAHLEKLKREDEHEKQLELLNQLPAVPISDLPDLCLDDRVVAARGQPASAPDYSSSNKHTEGLSKQELCVLATTSFINGRKYVPFLSVDLGEKFHFRIPFTDNDGKLKLTDKQQKRLKGWMRPGEFMEEPALIKQVDSGTIKQTVVSDCSFVASLTIAARYERRFGKQIVTSIIFPQNKNGQPVYNSDGKYMIKLHINGVWRKVVVDDFFPVGENMQPLCSHSQPSELWVSLLEKAYLKVMGGYDFPGSNSNIDLHALTGWIPERIAIKKDPSEFDPDKTFEKLLNRFHRGDCLITLATGKLPQTESERAGLVDCHAYALLDLCKINGKRLIMVKNPWTHLRWKGRFSENDLTSWTEELKKALDYDPSLAKEKDDGVFWIDYESVLHFFDVFYVNWNPALFPFTYGIHSAWTSTSGPVKDLYSVADNPQFSLNLNVKNGSAAVWILLTRHITHLEDFADNKEYITVMVYKGGKKVYLPFDPKPVYDGARINSPHYLCQMVLTEPGPVSFTLVVAQYEKTTTIYYTLRMFSSVDFSLAPIRTPYRTKKTEKGEWKGKTAGGCGNGASRETFEDNPLFHLCLDEMSDDHSLLVDIRAPKQFSVAIELFLISSPRNKTFAKQVSGIYRPGYTVLTATNVPGGVFGIRPSTFLQGQEGPFILGVEASYGFTIKRVQ